MERVLQTPQERAMNRGGNQPPPWVEPLPAEAPALSEDCPLGTPLTSAAAAITSIISPCHISAAPWVPWNHELLQGDCVPMRSTADFFVYMLLESKRASPAAGLNPADAATC